MVSINLIAEIGQGHEGSLKNSIIHIKKAHKSGASSVKFQIVYAKDLATSTDKNFSLFKKIEMQENEWKKLFLLSKKLKMKFYAEIFGKKSLTLVNKIGIQNIKIHPTDLNNYEFLNSIKKSSIKEIIIGVGGAFKKEIIRSIRFFKKKEVVVMLGYQSYPTKLFDNNLIRIKELSNVIRHKKISFGFADHSVPREKFFENVISLAIGCGATHIEKHFTIDRNLKLEDYETALEPKNFYILSKKIKVFQKILGKSLNKENFGMSSDETKYRNSTRRDVVAKKNIRKNKLIRYSDLTLKRTSYKKAIKDINYIINKKSLSNIKIDEPFTKNKIK